MNTERKYRKQVNKNGWMAKLHRICFGASAPKFMGYCPFFWFTWFCLLFFPLILVIRAIFALFGIVGYLYRSLKSTAARRPKDSELLRFYRHLLEIVGFDSREEALEWTRVNNALCFKVVFAWIAVTPDWENCAQQVLNQFLQREGKKRERAEANASRTQWLSKYGGYIVKPILGALGLAISYLVVQAGIFLIPQITWRVLLIGLEALAAILVLTIFIVLIYGAAVAIRKHYRKCPKDPNRVGFLRKTARALLGISDFIEETVSTIYTRECPLIEWGDESGPITRNE